MPSSQKTLLGLNQWQSQDIPDFDDHNADNLLIDDAIQDTQKTFNTEIQNIKTASFERYTPTLLNGWTEPWSGYGVEVCRTGNIVVINGLVRPGVVDSGTNVFNLPESFRPTSGRDKTFAIFGENKNEILMRLVVRASGAVNTWGENNVATNVVYINMTYACRWEI